MKTKLNLMILISILALIFWQCDKEPDCSLVCDIGMDEYSIDITCESGSTTTTFNNQRTEYQYDNGVISLIILHLNQTRTYENTKNTYLIVGEITVNKKLNTVTHNITVSGGAFKNPQTCN